MNLKVLLNQKFRTRMKILRSNNGSEFNFAKFTKFCN